MFQQRWFSLASGAVQDRHEVLRTCRCMRTWFADLEGTGEPAINDLVHSIEALAPTPTSRPPTLTTTPFRAPACSPPAPGTSSTAFMPD
ncbi:hypothetical protein OV203_02650 [Nannocystis sp. ILAH1]|uniref:hypothetical protein n=1 Tax=unclassified Nannocystis TaxID=2627009 RepID=UPI00226E5F4A|nr:MULTISPECIES: hypothetical protein [unclassified Nannocystis]MCY0986011.1 hypothetical protein [Nannocystis sp. ILAH1]MCY1068607.1 hypothetical protein [Nannocystis sp. RBIL2]